MATSEAPEGLEGPQSLHEIPLNQRRQPLQAFLVLGWTVEHEGECATAVERSHKLLPLVADAASAVIASILLAERIHELESTSVREALEGMDGKGSTFYVRLPISQVPLD